MNYNNPNNLNNPLNIAFSSQNNSLNLNKTHPLITNANEYLMYRKYVSIHSEDRDTTKYPSSASFEIELPEDYLNVVTVKLNDWTFPCNYNTFSQANSNIVMTFQINSPYNPALYDNTNPLQNAIFQALYSNINNDYIVTITEGFYTPIQIVTELTNRFNDLVTQYILNYFKNNTISGFPPSQYPPSYFINQYNSIGGYTDFVVVFNAVSQKVWFGNRSSNFVLTNNSLPITSFLPGCYSGRSNKILPDSNNWGLPSFVGLPSTPVTSVTNPNNYVKFYYGSVNSGDLGTWLTPNPYMPGCQVSSVECVNKINIFGPTCIYLEIEGMNCIDETIPFAVNPFTTHTNETSGVVNSSFAKIGIPTTPLSEWYDRNNSYYKLYNPPAERIRKIKLRFRYHNNVLCDFSNLDYTMTLEFTMLQPQSNMKSIVTR
jgi:hypothetical protein